MPFPDDIGEITWHARTQVSKPSLNEAKTTWIGYATGIPPGLSAAIRTNTRSLECEYGLYHGR
jgi:hypothetical protein